MQATAFGATFVAMGSPIHEENTIALNRLIQIENELKTQPTYKPREGYNFPVYKEQLQEAEETDASTAKQEVGKQQL